MVDLIFEKHKKHRENMFKEMLENTNNSKINIFGLIAQLKVYFQNSTSYLAIANFIMILATFKHTYNIDISLFVLAPFGLFVFLLIGYLDYKLIYLKQATYINKQNDVKHQLNRIEEQLKILGGKEQ